MAQRTLREKIGRIAQRVASHVDALETSKDALSSSLLALRVMEDFAYVDGDAESFTVTLPEGTTPEAAQKAVNLLQKIAAETRKKVSQRSKDLKDHHLEALEDVPDGLIAEKLRVRNEDGRVQVYVEGQYYPDNKNYGFKEFAHEIKKHLINIAFAAQSKESHRAATV